MQIYRMNPFITTDGDGRASTNAYIEGCITDADADIFARGPCIPSDNKMTVEEQNMIIDVIKSCYEV